MYDTSDDDIFSSMFPIDESTLGNPPQDIWFPREDEPYVPPRTSETDLDPTTLEFARSLGIDLDAFVNNPKNDYKSTRDVNPIVHGYGVFDTVSKPIMISIADLVGHDDCRERKGNNILFTFHQFYDRYGGTTYQSRALSLLEYKSGEELLEGLRRRNDDTRDMRVKEVEEGKYVISGNGLHRFSVLRFHYLADLSKKEKSEEELRELYTIPVTLDSKVNLFKTYCNFIICRANNNIKFITFYTGEDPTIYFTNGEVKKIDESQLLSLTQESVDLLDAYSIYPMLDYYEDIPTFRQFVDTYVPKLAERIKSEKEKSNDKIDRGY